MHCGSLVICVKFVKLLQSQKLRFSIFFSTDRVKQNFKSDSKRTKLLSQLFFRQFQENANIILTLLWKINFYTGRERTSKSLVGGKGTPNLPLKRKPCCPPTKVWKTLNSKAPRGRWKFKVPKGLIKLFLHLCEGEDSILEYAKILPWFWRNQFLQGLDKSLYLGRSWLPCFIYRLKVICMI